MLALLVFITMLATAGIAQRISEGMPVDFTPQAMFMGDGGEWDRLQSYEEEFGAEDNTMIALIEGPVNTNAGLDLLTRIHEAASGVEGVEGVDSVINASIAIGDSGGMIAVEDAIVDGNQPLSAAMTDAFLSPMLVATDGRAAAVQIHLHDELQAISDLAPVVWAVNDAVRAAHEESAASPDFEVHVTGIPFVRAEVVAMMVADHEFFFPVVALVFLVTIIGLFKRFWVGVVPLLGVLMATVWTMGILLSSGAVLNILSILTPTLVLVIGVADGIHLVSRYREELVSTDDPEVAMGTTVQRMLLACFLTTFTTGAGFATLMVADTDVIRDFGLQTALGVMLTFVAVMLAVPTLLAWVPLDRVGHPNETPNKPLYDKLAIAVKRYPKRIVAGALVLTGIAGWTGRSVHTDSGLLEMYRPGHPTWEAVQTAERTTGGVIPIFIHISGADGQMLEPAIIERIDALETALRAIPLTGTTVSFAGWIEHFHGLLMGGTGWPATREAVAQELLLAELTGDLPLERVLSADRARTRIVAFTKDTGGRDFLVAKQHLEATAAGLFAGTGIVTEVTGDGMLAAHGVDRLIRDLLASLLLMLGVIALTMFALLRNLKHTAIATFPNLVPLVFILGTLGWLGADLQTSNIVSFTVAVGLAVDDTIHFIVRYREERQNGVGTDEAIRRTFQGAGHAIVLTSILLIFGFGVLALSSLTSTYFFGLLACITMAAAVLGDLLLLPALLHLFDKP